MQKEMSYTGKRTRCFRWTVALRGIRFQHAGFGRSKWIALGAAIALVANARSEQAASETDAADLAEFGARASELISRVATAAAPAARESKTRGQGVGQRSLHGEVAGGVQVHRRPGNQTVMRLRPSTPAAAPKHITIPELNEPHEATARKFLSAHRVLLRLADPDTELALVSTERDALGYERLRFKQEYQGLPVWPAELNVHFNPDGKLGLLEGAYSPTPALNSVKPALSAEEAVRRALAAIAPGGTASTSNPDLIVYSPLDERGRLAWKFELNASLLERWLVVVDANDGTILQRSNLVCGAQVQASGTDLFGAKRPLHAWQTNNTYYLVDTSKKSYDPAYDPLVNPHGVIEILDAQGASYDDVLDHGGQIVTSTRADNWPVPAAVSAAFNLSEVYDYYLERHGRNSVDGQGGDIGAVVRVTNFDNGLWVPDLRLIVFSDSRTWAGSLDVVGHEVTHGVEDFSAGLTGYAQPGALREAFSDIFGEMVEARTRGRTDWQLGSELAEPVRNLKDPSALITVENRPYPAKMSDYVNSPATGDWDRGDIHINSMIVSHAFYLLAEGLTNAIGLRSAESIFYRCLSRHLLPQSQFIDCRLGCLASAEELFGKDSVEVKMTAQAFDAVEIFDGPGSSEPTPVPITPGMDSTLLVAYDGDWDTYDLGRREIAQGDNALGSTLATDVLPSRPSVTADGSLVLFVTPEYDLCAVDTADSDSRQCLGLAGKVYSAAISPDGTFAAFVLRNPKTGDSDNQITLLDLASKNLTAVSLVAPKSEGISTNTILYANLMTFTADGADLVYDALCRVKFGAGPTVDRWGIYSVHLATGETSLLVPPRDGIDAADPALSPGSNRYLTYDSQDATTLLTSVMVMDLSTGQQATVGTVTNALGFPSFLSDESGLIYAAPDPFAAASGMSLFKQDLAGDRLHSQGPIALWSADAGLGIIYRRATLGPTNALPTVAVQTSADQIAAQGSVTLTATAADADGNIAKVEFYDGSTKLGQVESAPYTFLWQPVPAGNHLLKARAIDNLGGATDSSPRLVTAAGGPSITLSIRATAQEALRLTVSGEPGYYVISTSEDLKTWADIYGVIVDASRTGSIDDAGGPRPNSHLFYRARPD